MDDRLREIEERVARALHPEGIEDYYDVTADLALREDIPYLLNALREAREALRISAEAMKQAHLEVGARACVLEHAGDAATYGRWRNISWALNDARKKAHATLGEPYYE